MELAILFGVIIAGIFEVEGHPQIIQPPRRENVDVGNMIQPPRQGGERTPENEVIWIPPPNGNRVGKLVQRMLPPRLELESSGNEGIWIPHPVSNYRPVGNIVQPLRWENGRSGPIIQPPRQDYTLPRDDGVWIPNGSPVRKPAQIIQPPRRETGDSATNQEVWIPPPNGRPVPVVTPGGNIVQPPRRENGNSGNQEVWIPPPNGRPVPVVTPGGNIVQPPRRENGSSGNQEVWIPPPNGRPVGNIIQPPRRERGGSGIIIPIENINKNPFIIQPVTN